MRKQKLIVTDIITITNFSTVFIFFSFRRRRFTRGHSGNIILTQWCLTPKNNKKFKKLNIFHGILKSIEPDRQCRIRSRMDKRNTSVLKHGDSNHWAQHMITHFTTSSYWYEATPLSSDAVFRSVSVECFEILTMFWRRHYYCIQYSE